MIVIEYYTLLLADTVCIVSGKLYILCPRACGQWRDNRPFTPV